MLRNFFLVAFRNLRKNRLYSFINISGLSVGIVCTILILLWVDHETTYDKFLPKYERLNQVWLNAEFDGTINSWRSVPLPSYEAMKTADVRIVNSCVMDWGYVHLLTVGDNKIYKRGYYASEEFFEMFEFPLVKGDPSIVLDEPNSIVISESLAETLFGDEDPINRIIRVDDEGDLQVTGVVQDVPDNSTFKFEFILPWKYRENTNPWVLENQDNWGNNSFQVFVELDAAANHDVAEANIRDMVEEHGQDDMPKKLVLYPMPRWRLYSSFENGVEKGGISDYVQLFTVIAIFILVIACINFMNLSTARSEKRAKEVGIRKSIGSSRTELILQFIGESVIIAMIAFLIAILLVLLILPYFNILVDKQLFLDFTSLKFWLWSVSLILLTGIIAGSYPAFYLSGFNPVRTLKGSIVIGKNAGIPRKVLVVIQFGVAIVLMIGTLVILRQINLVRDRQIGYDQTNLITLDFTDEFRDQYEVFKNEVLRNGAVEAMTRANGSVTQINSNNFLGWPGKPEEQRVIFTTVVTEYDYAETMGIDMIMGRDFSEDFKSDTSAIVVNKAALDLMQLESPVIGTELDLWGSKRTLIGVMDNVLMGSLYQDIQPLFMVLQDWGGVVTLRLNRNQDIQKSLSEIEDIYTELMPAYPFDYSFVDVEFEEKFTQIKLSHRLAIIFAVIAMIITGLGLFGLASFTAEQRTKEIGIRKILGASVTHLVGLMSRDFTLLVVISFFIATPVSWYLLDKYLDRYEIRTTLEWWIFPLVGVAALLFALLIVSHQARRAAQANPVKSLRSE